MKKIVKVLMAFFLTLSTLPLTQVKAAEQLTIVTSFYPMYAMTSELVGDKHQVLMINSGNGIHGFEPSASDVAAIYDADLFIYHSSSLESWTKNLEANKGNHPVKMIQASDGLSFKVVPGLESLAQDDSKLHGNQFDLHSWVDPIEAANEVTLIAEALAEVDPENAEMYAEKAQLFTDEAQKMTERYTEIFAKSSQKTFVTQHTAFYYLAERFGLNQLGVTGISSESEPSARQLNDVMKFVQKQDVHTLFIEPKVSDRIAKMIASSTGVEIVELSPLETDPQNDLTFLENLEAQLKILSDHLK